MGEFPRLTNLLSSIILMDWTKFLIKDLNLKNPKLKDAKKLQEYGKLNLKTKKNEKIELIQSNNKIKSLSSKRITNVDN